MISNMSHKQHNNHLLQLKKVLKAIKGSKLSTSLDIEVLSHERDLDILYSEYCELVPVQSALGYTNYLRAISGNPRENPYELFTHQNLALSGIPDVAVTAGEDSAFPLTKQAMKASFSLEQLIFEGKIENLPKVKGSLFHIFESPEEFLIGSEHTIAAGEFRALRLNYLNFFQRRKFLPHLDKMKAVGKSKYQRIHAFLDQLEKHGEHIEVLMARPQVVNDLALYLAQREGKFIPLKELCPHLKVLLHYDERIAPYKKNLDHFFQGLNIDYIKMMLHPSGIMGIQSRAKEKGRMTFYNDMGAFYEFIPEDDMRPDGSLMRYHRRFHTGQLEINQSYLLIVSNDSGLLGYNSGLIFTVNNTAPLQLTFKRMSETLNVFEERLSLDLLEDLVYSANENLSSHGFNIREYMVGDDIDNHKSHWVFELSCTLDGIQDQYLQSVANQLHNEMSLKNRYYKDAIRTRRMKSPEITFLPLGSISDVDTDSVLHHIDLSEDAERVRRIIQKAKVSRTFRPDDI